MFEGRPAAGALGKPRWAKGVPQIGRDLVRLIPIALAIILSESGGLEARAQGAGDALQGPFFYDSELMRQLDCPTAECTGPLNFGRLLSAREPRKRATVLASNPFNLPVASQVLATIKRDLGDIRTTANATDGQLSPNFLTDAGSRIELVGVVNRMDRQFIKDPNLHLSKEQLRCGEISLIYRFSYSIRDGHQSSRLPVTMNIVLPAVPYDDRGGKVTCQVVARRWLSEIDKGPGRTPEQVSKDLLNEERGPLAFIAGADILRMELNMQAYRKSAQADETRFGTEAAYLIRVFKWDDENRLFLPDILRNQIDRNKVLCSPGAASCVKANERRRKLVAFLQQKDTLSALDKGTLEVDYGLGVLADRAVTISPGGSHRSQNQPYWSAGDPSEAVITDAEIELALAMAKTLNVRMNFIKSVEDFRARLNDSTCSGCHQTRAIAGFHFPGADREQTDAVNSVFLPASPHFYGDQPRRMEILQKMASRSNTRLSENELASGYSARPMEKYADDLSGTQLVGGWGGACLKGPVRDRSARGWDCRKELTCELLFDSKNDPGVGTCVPQERHQVGDALQKGKVRTTSFGQEKYFRLAPESSDERIPTQVLPSPAPAGNSYYGAHQEFYKGDIDSTDKAVRRDARTGGFPAGMLRLSECANLPREATCGLIASSGFNDCIGRLATDADYSVKLCFRHFTSYAGVRACDRSNPCRDDYICVRPMGYHPKDSAAQFEARQSDIKESKYFREINRRDYDPTDFGQKMPDAEWTKRDDQRGLCIPPYFVFQFRSDGHPAPSAR
ncbi:hypothetical protein IVB41_12485 [Bradyrhizobium sp. 44]|uniref:hypothetical protein n=1 Tax=Bradyrhizobium sp. 44 TaxID=2782675 RepID=UPI001FFC165F|nr:hypothetical protein [Bradyrhizobium sp. 44]MCK1284733.1 hypothetical protein [Bradyrhizobium sp. 44]